MTRSRVPGCSTRSRTISTTRRSGSRAGSNSVCASPARWPLIRRSCYSTSPAPLSIRNRRRLIEELIIKLRDDVAVVIVTHNLQQAYRIADYVAFMYLG